MVESHWYVYPALVAAGAIAGFINTLAGSGSLLTLPLLIFLGLPPTVANATNRIGVLFAGAVSSTSFRQQKIYTVRESARFLVPSIIGSVTGALVATRFNEEVMRTLIGILLVFMFFMILYKPEKWIRDNTEMVDKLPRAVLMLIFFVIGLYGGFIQAGVGFFLLAALVYGAGASLTKANALKVFIMFIFTAFAVVVFMFSGQIHYEMGLVLAMGNAIGAFIGSRVAVSWGPKFVRVVLLVVIFLSAMKLTGIIDFIITMTRNLTA